MPEGGDFEMFTGPAPSEQSEMSDEQFSEEMRRTQAAVKQLKKEEGKAKANDSSLAGIIVQFLSQPQNTDLFLLISRTVAQNIPSEIIIAVLSLVDEQAEKEVGGLLEGMAPERALVVHQKADFENLSPELKAAIDQWVANLAKSAMAKPHRTLESVLIQYPERHLSPVLLQLSAFILRNFLNQKQGEIDFQILHEFMQKVWVEVIKGVENLVKGQRHLESSSPEASQEPPQS